MQVISKSSIAQPKTCAVTTSPSQCKVIFLPNSTPYSSILIQAHPMGGRTKGVCWDMNRDQIRVCISSTWKQSRSSHTRPEAVTQGLVKAVNGKVASATLDQLNTSFNL